MTLLILKCNISYCQAKAIGSSLAAAIGAMVDLKFVRNVVDIAIDR